MQDPFWPRPYIRHATALLALKQYSAAQATLQQGIEALQQQPNSNEATQELSRALEEVKAAVAASAAAGTGHQGTGSTSTARVPHLGPEGPVPAAKRPRLDGQGTAGYPGQILISNAIVAVEVPAALEACHPLTPCGSAACLQAPSCQVLLSLHHHILDLVAAAARTLLLQRWRFWMRQLWLVETLKAPSL